MVSGPPRRRFSTQTRNDLTHQRNTWVTCNDATSKREQPRDEQPKNDSLKIINHKLKTNSLENLPKQNNLKIGSLENNITSR